MRKVKLTITKSHCRGGYVREGEAVVYSIAFSFYEETYELKKKKPVLYACAANLASMIIGFILADKVPMLF